MVSMGSFVKFASCKVLTNLVFLLAIAVPYWYLLGLL